MMYLSTTGKNETIKSNELVEIINQFREVEGGKAELRHNDFMAKIRKEVETLKNLGLDNQRNFSPVEYVDAKGEKRPCFELTRDGMLQMLNSESVLVRYKTIEYINVLEEKITNKQPIGILESMQLELKSTKQELSELKQMFYEDKRRKVLKINAPLEERLSLVSDEEIMDIIKLSLSIGKLRNVNNGIAIDKNVVVNEAFKRNIDKYTLNKKLVLLGIVILNGYNYPYKQVKIDGETKWCYVVKNNVV